MRAFFQSILDYAKIKKETKKNGPSALSSLTLCAFLECGKCESAL